MKAWFVAGGPIMPALLVLGVVLYTIATERLIALYGPRALDAVRDVTQRRRGLLILRALVAAAPLLGLLGTVSGMIDSFDGLVAGGRLADIGQGIGHALRTTQYGLAVAVPGIIVERVISRRSVHLERQVAA